MGITIKPDTDRGRSSKTIQGGKNQPLPTLQLKERITIIMKFLAVLVFVIAVYYAAATKCYQCDDDACATAISTECASNTSTICLGYAYSSGSGNETVDVLKLDCGDIIPEDKKDDKCYDDLAFVDNLPNGATGRVCYCDEDDCNAWKTEADLPQIDDTGSATMTTASLLLMLASFVFAY